jgi:hypothetical protein
LVSRESEWQCPSASQIRPSHDLRPQRDSVVQHEMSRLLGLLNLVERSAPEQAVSVTGDVAAPSLMADAVQSVSARLMRSVATGDEGRGSGGRRADLVKHNFGGDIVGQIRVQNGRNA